MARTGTRSIRGQSYRAAVEPFKVTPARGCRKPRPADIEKLKREAEAARSFK